MSESMIERCAKAAYEKGACPLNPGPWNDALRVWGRDSTPENERYCREFVRAVFAAAREPTEEVLRIGDEASSRLDRRFERGNAEEVWTEMIDAILAEKP